MLAILSRRRHWLCPLDAPCSEAPVDLYNTTNLFKHYENGGEFTTIEVALEKCTYYLLPTLLVVFYKDDLSKSRRACNVDHPCLRIAKMTILLMRIYD